MACGDMDKDAIKQRRHDLYVDLHQFADEIFELFKEQEIDIAGIGWDHQQLHVVITAYLQRFLKIISHNDQAEVQKEVQNLILQFNGLKQDEANLIAVYHALAELVPLLWD